MVICASCGTENESGRKFCMECGQRLAEACPSCGTLNAAGAKFCGECGTPLGGAAPASGPDVARPPTAAGMAAAPEAGSGAPVAERRLVSVMFVDLVGSTSLAEGSDAEDTREMLSGYFETARDIVDRHGGIIEKFIGDAVMAVWGTPTAHEDDAERAVRTALQLVEAVGRMEAGGKHLQARAGVLTGEAAVTIGATSQGMVAGDLVNTASRLQSAATPGTVLVGEATYRAAQGAIAFEEAGEQQLKGKEQPVPTWRATASSPAAADPDGRRSSSRRSSVATRSCGPLKDQFHATAREGKPRLVTIVGQAGIGKSRLGLGAREVPRRSGREHPLARGPLPVVRRGDQLLGAGRDGPRKGGDRRLGGPGFGAPSARRRCSTSSCRTPPSGAGSSRGSPGCSAWTSCPRSPARSSSLRGARSSSGWHSRRPSSSSSGISSGRTRACSTSSSTC